MSFFHVSLPPPTLKIKNISPLIFTLCLTTLVIFENCTMQLKVLCKIPGSQLAKAEEVDFSTGVSLWNRSYFSTLSFANDPVAVDLPVAQMVCLCCTEDRSKTSWDLRPYETAQAEKPLWCSMDVHAHCMARREIWVFTSCCAKLCFLELCFPELCFPELLWVQNLFSFSAQCFGFFSLLHN